MIPRTFPSVEENNKRLMVVYPLASVVGLQAWIDYIPVKSVSENTAVENTYANTGYILTKSVTSTSGLQSFKDYIPVYEDASYTIPWSTNFNGFIPVYGLYISGAYLVQEDGFKLLTEASDPLITE